MDVVCKLNPVEVIVVEGPVAVKDNPLTTLALKLCDAVLTVPAVDSTAPLPTVMTSPITVGEFQKIFLLEALAPAARDPPIIEKEKVEMVFALIKRKLSDTAETDVKVPETLSDT